MKSSGFIPIITPAAVGWNVWLDGHTAQSTATFAQAAELVPPGSAIHLALPAHALIFERLRLPATERQELVGMVQLQWEKSLPFTAEEVAGDFIILSSAPQESTVLTIAAPNAALEAFSQELRARNLQATRVTPYVSHLVGRGAKEQETLLVYREDSHWVMAIVSGSRLAWVHVLAGGDAASLSAEIPQLLLAANLEGVGTNFTSVSFSPEAAELQPLLAQTLAVPAIVEPLPLPPYDDDAPNLLPAAWVADARRRENAGQNRRRLVVAAACWAFLVLCGGIHLFFLQRQSHGLEREIAPLRARLAVQQQLQARSQALDPVIEPQRYALEILRVVREQIPGDGVTLTEFDQGLDQWHVTGEAPSASLAIEFVTRLKQQPQLNSWQITSATPQILANERARFSIFGKL